MSEVGSYRKRRDTLMSGHPGDLFLVRGQGPEGLNPNFFYLTGVEEPRAALLLAPEGIRIETGAKHPGPNYVRGRMVRQILFLPTSDPLAKKWGEDSVATVEQVEPAGVDVDAVLPIGELEPLLGRTLPSVPKLHYVRAAMPVLSGGDDPDVEFVGRVRQRFFDLKVRDATPAIHEARKRKDAGEIQAMQRAIDLTGEALDAVLGMIGAGVHEYELEAEITRRYRASEATHAFDPIVGTGANACSLHYTRNRGRLEAGQLVLIDTGASLHGYKGDITRTFPVDGRFTDRQRTVYETVLASLREAIAICRPGALLGDIHAKAFEVIDRAGFGEFFIHGTSHHLGLDTHDVGDVHRPLEPGAVITVEPGIYLPEEALGVRLEEDVLITDGGHEVLSRKIPLSIEAIEERMA